MKKVRLYENERLDIPDALGLQDEVYSYVARFFGAVIGECAGLSDVLKIDYAGYAQNKTVEISGKAYVIKTFSTERVYENDAPEGFLDAKDQAYPGAKASYCFHFNSEVSPREVDLSALHAATIGANKPQNAIYYSIWARRIRINTDTETRRFWDETTGGEVSQNVETRTKSSVEWTVGLSGSADLIEGGWIRAFDCVGINGEATDEWLKSYSNNNYAENIESDAFAPIFRPVLFWDFVRQHQPNPTNNILGGNMRIEPGDFPSYMAESEGKLRTTPTKEHTGKYSFASFRHPSQPVIGTTNDKIVMNSDSVIDNDGGTNELHPRALDLLTALEATTSDIAFNKTNPGMLTLITAITEQLCELKYGPISGLRNPQNGTISPWAFTGVGQVLPNYEKKESDTLLAGGTTTVVDTATDNKDDDISLTAHNKTVRANLNTVRPLLHLNQFYNNWGRSHPQVLLSGMLCTRIDAPDYEGLDQPERFSNFKWYGPLYNPLGFQLEQHNGALMHPMSVLQQDQDNYLYPHADNNHSSAYAVRARIAPKVKEEYAMGSSSMYGAVVDRSYTGIIDSEFGNDGAPGWGDADDEGDHEKHNRGMFNGGYDLLIKPPGGIDDDEMHIFSVQCTETSSWGPLLNAGHVWPSSPYGYFPDASDVAGDHVYTDQNHAVSPNAWNLRAHVGSGRNLFSGVHHNSENNIFVMCQPPPRWRQGELTQTDANYVRYCWFFITVLGVAPNHLTADRVFRGQRSFASTDRAMLDSYWQYKWAQPYVGDASTGAAYVSDPGVTLYGPDAAALSLANQRLNNHPDTSYYTDGSGKKGGTGGFWSYARPDLQKK